MPLLTPDRPLLRVRFGLAARLSLTLISAAALVFVTAFYYDYRESRRHMLDITQEVLSELSTAIAHGVDMMQRDVEAVAIEVARGITEGNTSAELRRRALDALASSQECQGVAVRIVTAGNPPDGPALYCHRSRLGGVCEYQEADDATFMQWPRDDLSADRSEAIGWSEPQIAPNQNEPATFYELPIYRPSPTGPVPVAIVSAKLTLAHLTTVIERLRPFRSGYAVILSKQGRYFSYPGYSDRDWAAHGTIFERARFYQQPALQLIGERMTRGETGFMPFQSRYLHDQPVHTYFAPLPRTGWSIGVVFADRELFAPLSALVRDVVLIGSVGLVLLLVLVILIVGRFIHPLLMLTEKSAAIAGGDLDIAIPESRSHDEVGILTDSFARMRRALRQQLEILAETRATQARIDNELQIARTIQASFLPRDLAGLAGSSGLALAAWFQPAREVGGDLYNGFWLDDGRLFLCIGDVAGKGVPAALMMAVTTTLMKAVAASVPDPAEILQRVNRELCAINEEMLFVTLFAAALTPETGELMFSNAGHNPPVRLRANGRPEWIGGQPGLVLGVEPEFVYTVSRLQLEPGETLLLYTDGLNEAMNAADECFGNEQLLAVGRAGGGDNPVQLTERVVAAVAAHVGNAEQSDDLTLLVVKRLPAADEAIQVCLPAELERLPELLEPIRQAAERAGLAEAQVMRLELAVEEALVNLCNHAYADQTAPGPVYCRIAMQPESLLVEIADEGPPFDPLARPDPDTTLELEEREPGGLGVFLIKTLVSEVDYRREEGRNVLTLRMLKTSG